MCHANPLGASISTVCLGFNDHGAFWLVKLSGAANISVPPLEEVPAQFRMLFETALN